MGLLAKLCNLLVLGRLRDRPGPFDPARVGKILVVRSDNIGDVICSTPAMLSLRRLFPQAHLAALVCTLSQDVLQQHPALDRLYVYPKAKHRYRGYGKLRSWWLLAKTLGAIRREKYDLALSLRSDFSVSLAWLVYASKARWKAGPQAPPHRKSAFFYNTPLPPPPGRGHEAQRVLNLLKSLGLDAGEEPLCLGLPPASQAKAGAFLAGHGITRPPLVLNVAYWPYTTNRNWRTENYRELIERLPDVPLVITHGPGQEQWLAQNVLAGLNCPVFFGAHLLDLAALLARSALFITVEGGMMHLAAGAGTAVLGLFKAKQRERWYPWQVEHKIVDGGDNVNNITVEQVLEALGQMPAFQALRNLTESDYESGKHTPRA